MKREGFALGFAIWTPCALAFAFGRIDFAAGFAFAVVYVVALAHLPADAPHTKRGSE